MENEAKRLYHSHVEHLEWEEFVSGWGAGLFNVTLTFPIHKLMFRRQMLYNIPTSAAFAQIRAEGLSLLYRGLLPPLCQKTISSSIIFGSYHYYSKSLIRELPQINEQICKSTGAALAGMTEALLTPLERLQTVLQVSPHPAIMANPAIPVPCITHKREIDPSSSSYFTGHKVPRTSSKFRSCFSPHLEALWFGGILPWWECCTDKEFGGSGGTLGAAISSMFYPMNVVKTRMQVRLGGPYDSFLVVFKIVYNERGRKMRNVYRGVHLNVIRSLISWGIINASYELIRNLIRRYQSKYSLGEYSLLVQPREGCKTEPSSPPSHPSQSQSASVASVEGPRKS